MLDSLCIVKMGVYVAMGSLIFTSSDMVSESYFSFVTLATIGKHMLEIC
jgi:hypothetical protein